MSSQTQTYADRAEQCEQMAVRMRSPEARIRFVDLARHWRALAKADVAGRDAAGVGSCTISPAAVPVQVADVDQ
jgi:hypothetical protein